MEHTRGLFWQIFRNCYNQVIVLTMELSMYWRACWFSYRFNIVSWNFQDNTMKGNNNRKKHLPFGTRCRRGRDRMVVGFTSTCAISAYHHQSWQFEPRSWQDVLDTVCDQVCQWRATGRWFSPDTPVSSTNKTDLHDIAEILLKVALNTINQTKQNNEKNTFPSEQL